MVRLQNVVMVDRIESTVDRVELLATQNSIVTATAVHIDRFHDASTETDVCWIRRGK